MGYEVANTRYVDSLRADAKQRSLPEVRRLQWCASTHLFYGLIKVDGKPNCHRDEWSRLVFRTVLAGDACRVDGHRCCAHGAPDAAHLAFGESRARPCKCGDCVSFFQAWSVWLLGRLCSCSNEPLS